MALRGWEGAIRVATAEADLATASNEAKVQSVSITHGPNLEAVREIGDRSPVDIKEGNIEIGLDVEILYVSGSNWPSRAGVGSTGVHTEYFVGVYPAGYASGKPKIVLKGKFSDWSLDVTQDGLLTEHVAFVGKTISVGTI